MRIDLNGDGMVSPQEWGFTTSAQDTQGEREILQAFSHRAFRSLSGCSEDSEWRLSSVPKDSIVARHGGDDTGMLRTMAVGPSGQVTSWIEYF